MSGMSQLRLLGKDWFAHGLFAQPVLQCYCLYWVRSHMEQTGMKPWSNYYSIESGPIIISEQITQRERCC